jgi:hypothetical protein
MVNRVTFARLVTMSLTSVCFAILLSSGPMAPPAAAESPGTCSSVLLSGSSWLGGGGVNVMSNGADEGTGASCGGTSYVNGVVAGSEWQCVELINRLYLTKGWIRSTWHGNGGRSSPGAADSLYDEAPAGLSKQPNGSISYVGPGDEVSIDIYESGSFVADGHALIVNTAGRVSSGSVPLVSENSGSPSDATPQIDGTLSGGTLTIPGGGGWSYTVIGVVHAPGGGAPGDGSFVQVAGSAAIYRIAGDAPLYVSNWSAFGGSQPYTVISQQQFNALRPYPADGTFISSTSDGRVYEIAGGAPEYVSAADANKVPGWGSRPVVGVDQWDIANTSNPAAHLRPYPVDGTVIYNVDDGRVYVVAGGAPEYVSAADASQVPAYESNPHIGLSGYEFSNYQHLRPDPADGTLISNVDTGRAYVVAGGAPEWISAADASKIPGWGRQAVTALSGYEFGSYQHLRSYPLDGTFLVTTSGKIYRVAGRAPFAISSWSVYRGIQPHVTIDQWDIDNAGAPGIGLRSAPVDGTVVEGLPSRSYWSFSGGYRSPSALSPSAVQVDDLGLAAYPQVSAGSSGGPGGSAGSAAPGGARSLAGASGTMPHGGDVCVVPRLRHMTVGKARRALKRAHCGLGKVRRPHHRRHHHTLRVEWQSAKPRSRHKHNYRVAITLR